MGRPARLRGGGWGCGEVAPLPSFGTETEEEAGHRLARMELQRITVPDTGRMAWSLEGMGVDPTATPALYAGLELALWDRAARRAGVSLAKHLSPVAASKVQVQRLLSASTTADLADEAESAKQLGYRTLKIKVGANPLDVEVSRVAAVRERVGTDVRLRLDANGAWTVPEAKKALEAFFPFGIEFIEEPIAGGTPEHYRALRGTIPLAVDEAMANPSLAHDLIAEQAVDWIVLKPMIRFGIEREIDMAQWAATKGIGAVVTSSLDRLAGMAGALHLACAMPDPSVTCGLGTLDLLDSEDASHLPIMQGAMRLPAGAGLGITPC